MHGKITADGNLFVQGITEPAPPFLRRSRKSDWFYSTWLWFEEAEKEVKDWNSLGIEGLANLERLRAERAEVLKAVKGDSAVLRKLLNKIFEVDLWQIQRTAVSAMVLSKRFYLADDVGLGKTLSAFATLAVLKMAKKIDRATIVCTASVKHQWQSEIERAVRPEMRSLFTSTVIHGTKKERMERYQRDTFLKIVNYEVLRQDIATLTTSENSRRESIFGGAVVFDEAWKLKNRGTKTHGVMKKLFENTPYVFALNASPIANGYEDLFGVFDIVQPRIFICWSTFMERYLRIVKIRLKTGRTFPKTVGYYRVPEMREKTRSYMLRRSARDRGLSLPKMTVTTYYVELTPDQRLEYDRAKIHSKNPLEASTRARVACLFTPTTPPEKSPKFKELCEILLNSISKKEKVIIFSESRQFLAAILGPLRATGVTCELISGPDTSMARSLKVDAFTNGNLRALLLTSAGEAGLNLQAASVVINLDFPWNAERLRQRVGRVRPYLGEKSRLIRVLNILAEDSIEERVVERIKAKVKYVERMFLEPQLDLTGVFDKDSLFGDL